MTKLTDRQAVLRALHAAIEAEESIIDSWMPPDWAPDEYKRQHIAGNSEQISLHQRNIEAFTRVLDRYYGGRQRPLAFLKEIPVEDLPSTNQEFKAPGKKS